jgi:signal transduction histidine kinase
MKLSVQQATIGGFVVSFVIIMILSISSYNSIVRLMEDDKWVARTQETLKKLNEILADADEAETSERGYIITGDEKYLQLHKSSIVEIGHDMNDLRILTAGEDNQAKALDSLNMLVERRLNEINEMVELRKTLGFDAARQALEIHAGARLMESVRTTIAGMGSREEDLLLERQQRSESSARTTRILLPVGTLTSLLILYAVFFALNHEIVAHRRAIQEIHRLNTELEQRVIDRTAKLELTMKELEGFSYSISHDLRAPLRAISGFSSILTESCGSGLDDQGNHLLNAIRSNAEKMGKLIDALIAFTQLNRHAIEQSTIDMNTLAHAVLKELRERDLDRDVTVSIKELPRAMGHLELIRQLFIHLIDNALKFTQPKQNSTIEIGWQRDHGESIYYVKDNGVGFDMQYADKLFGVFQRLHRDEEFKGVGIGLSIVHRIVQKHGGRVWAEGKPGEGATFYFSLPSPTTR